MRSRRAFSLIELLIVIAIISVLTVITLVSATGLAPAANLSRTGQTVGDLLVLGRQEASARNRDVFVRLIQIDSASGPRAIQLWIADSTGTNVQPLNQLLPFRDNVILSTNAALSPLLTTDPALAGTGTFGAYGVKSYQAFRIRAGGKLDTSISTNNFLTLQLDGAKGTPPQNFYTLRVNPVTGRVTTHRP